MPKQDKAAQNVSYVCVVGGANMDIFGRPFAPLLHKDSNPGVVRTSPGGVGRNIAHNLALLGENVHLLTAFGGDAAAADLARGCREAGIGTSHALTLPEAATSVYLFITDAAGDMELAVSDMEIYRHLTPEYLAGQLPFLNGAALVVADTNLEREALAYLADSLECPLFVDAVSVTKAGKLSGLLHRVHTLKANRLEAGLLTGIPPGGEAATRQMGDALLAQGVRQVYISLGGEGIYCANGAESAFLPPVPTRVVNTTGAGDCLMAALAWAHRRGLGLLAAARAGQAAASICVAGPGTVNTALSAEKVLALLGESP